MRVTTDCVILRRFAVIWCRPVSVSQSELLGRLAESFPNELLALPSSRICENGRDRPQRVFHHPQVLEPNMSKRARKRRSRKGNAANHGRKPNA